MDKDFAYVIEKIERYNGFTYITVFRDMGYRNGYVLFPEELMKMIPEKSNSHTFEFLHSSINFYGKNYFCEDFPDREDVTICPMMVGFSFDHFGDAVDFETLKIHFPESETLGMKSGRHGEIRTLEDAEKICKEIIDQFIVFKNATIKLADVIYELCNPNTTRVVLNEIERLKDEESGKCEPSK